MRQISIELKTLLEGKFHFHTFINKFMHFQENNLYCEKDENAGVEIGIIRKIKRERVCEI